MSAPHTRIAYFDGVCTLCNGFVDFLIRRDRKARIRFAPLQGSTARTRIPHLLTEPPAYVIYECEGRTFVRSAAAIRLLIELGGIWKLANILLLIPAVLRDVFYNWVARNRYKWFGRRESCRLPTEEERGRFLE